MLQLFGHQVAATYSHERGLLHNPEAMHNIAGGESAPERDVAMRAPHAAAQLSEVSTHSARKSAWRGRTFHVGG
jgi:hypothetical protein